MAAGNALFYRQLKRFYGFYAGGFLIFVLGIGAL
jgi:hypothetical protein